MARPKPPASIFETEVRGTEAPEHELQLVVVVTGQVIHRMSVNLARDEGATCGVDFPDPQHIHLQRCTTHMAVWNAYCKKEGRHDEQQTTEV